MNHGTYLTCRARSSTRGAVELSRPLASPRSAYSEPLLHICFYLAPGVEQRRSQHMPPCTNEDSRSLGNLLRDDDDMDIHVCCLFIAPITRILGNGLGLPISGTWSASSISKAARPCSLGGLHRQLTSSPDSITGLTRAQNNQMSLL